MIGWTAIAVLALATLGIGTALLWGRRELWTLLASVLVFGLAGYAWQGTPDYRGAPAIASEDQPHGGEGLVDARREFFAPFDQPSRFVIVADGLARRGDFEQAAGLLGGVVARNPQDGEAWLALHVALVEHAGGRMTEPADYALRKAAEVLDTNLGPAFFAGIDALRGGELFEARQTWAAGLATAKPDAPGQEYLAERLAALDRMIEAFGAAAQAAGEGDGMAVPPPGSPAGPPVR